MKAKITNSKIFKYKKPKIKLYSLICLLSVFCLCESVAATSTFKQLQIVQQPTTKQPNTTRAEAERLAKEAEQLYKQGNAQSLTQARKKWEEALVLWRKIGDKQQQAVSLFGIGRIYTDLGENLKALPYFNRALPLFRAVGNRNGEADTLSDSRLCQSRPTRIIRDSTVII